MSAKLRAFRDFLRDNVNPESSPISRLSPLMGARMDFACDTASAMIASIPIGTLRHLFRYACRHGLGPFLPIRFLRTFDAFVEQHGLELPTAATGLASFPHDQEDGTDGGRMLCASLVWAHMVIGFTTLVDYQEGDAPRATGGP